MPSDLLLKPDELAMSLRVIETVRDESNLGHILAFLNLMARFSFLFFSQQILNLLQWRATWYLRRMRSKTTAGISWIHENTMLPNATIFPQYGHNMLPASCSYFQVSHHTVPYWKKRRACSSSERRERESWPGEGGGDEWLGLLDFRDCGYWIHNHGGP